MRCTRCKQPITSRGYARTKNGPHHITCPALASESMASEWWRTEGIYIDPDTEDVDWYDKRAELAQMAYIAGYKRGTEDQE